MPKEFYVFGEYRADSLARTLWLGNALVPLTAREFDTLWALLQRAGMPVDKSVFMNEVWTGLNIDETNIRKQVQSLRKKLGKSPGGQDYIQTIPNRGYMLAVEVAVTEVDPKPLPTREPEPATDEVPADLPEAPSADLGLQLSTLPHQTRRRRLWVLAFLGFAAVILAVVWLLTDRSLAPPLDPSPQFGRILARSTTEGHSPQRIPLAYPPIYTAISPKGDKLFAGDAHSHVLSIVSTKDHSIRTITLPREGGPYAVSMKGLLYIGSHLDGIMVVDVDREKLLPKIIPTGGPVWDMAITPDGEKLFLAMSEAGLKRLFTRTRRIERISDRVSPMYLAIDRQGKNLYVGYQNSGPGGRPGHDVVEVFDADRETVLWKVSGPPMVGGPLSVSPDGGLVLLNGLDACSSPQYDHVGCSTVPSYPFHLLRSSERQIVKTIDLPVWGAGAHFLDNSRFIVTDSSVSVMDAAKYAALEKWVPADVPETAVFARNGRRMYLSTQKNNSILVFDVEGPQCAPPQEGLRLFYPADGTSEDVVRAANLTAQGSIRFAPGRVGQSFYLDGSNDLFAPWTGASEIGPEDMTLSLYLKGADARGEMVVVDWTAENPKRGVRLIKSDDNRLVFQSWPGGGVVSGKTSLRPDRWYHVAVTRTNQNVTLYLNGEFEASGPPFARFDESVRGPLFLGADHLGHPSFRGWLDEIAFYERALSPQEVKAMYLLRESGSCKL